MTGQWDKESLQARVCDPKSRTRHEAGSPNLEEIVCYERYAKKHLTSVKRQIAGGHIVVMGMTPELRELACRLGDHVTSIDISEDAIEIYRDWLSPGERNKELIIQGNWFDMDRLLTEPADVIMGDGVFANIGSPEECRRLLGLIYRSLKISGCFLTRHVMIPSGFPLAQHEAEVLMARYRADELMDAEFGFDMRFFGLNGIAYDGETFLLDNQIVFKSLRRMVEEGRLAEDEYCAIRRYYFAGVNFIPPQTLWESSLAECGFRFDQTPLRGRLWYDYYRVYNCFK